MLVHAACKKSATQLYDNGFLFQPKCKTPCFVSTQSKEYCTRGHDDFFNVPIENRGNYFLFPSDVYHCGYYNDDADKIIINAQLFTTFKKDDDDFHRLSRAIMSDTNW